MTEEDQVEEVADFFANISQEFSPLNLTTIPHVDRDREIQDIPTTDVISRLVHMRKPKSSVSIDLPPRLLPAVVHLLSLIHI